VKQLSPEEWTRISLGDLKNFSDDKELSAFIASRKAHITNIDLFKELYLWQKPLKLEFPPEYHNGFNLDPRLEAVLQLMKKYNVKDLLDIGSRAGYLLFAGKLKGVITKGTGVELATCYYDLCQRAVSHFNISGIDFINSMIEDFTTDRKYDCAVIAEVLEHVIDPLTVLKKAKSLLKDSGYLIITVPTGRFTASSEEIEIIKSEKIQEHVHYFSRDYLTEVAQSAGFKYIEAFSIGHGWTSDISIYSA